VIQEPPLTLHQLHIFAAVAQIGSFTRAAEALLLSGPAVSQHVASLERAVGSQLLERPPGKPVRLTRAGKRLLTTYESMSDQLATTLLELDALKRAENRCVAFGVTPTFHTYVLPSIYGLLQEASAEPIAQTDIGLRHDLLDALLKRRFDLVAVVGPLDDARMESAFLVSADVVFVGPPEHPLARETLAPFSALSLEHLIVAKWFGGGDLLEETAARLGVSLQMEAGAWGLPAQVRAVASGTGIALVPFYAVSDLLREKRLSLLRIEGFPVRQDWFIVSRADGISESVHEFKERLLSCRTQLAALCQCPDF